MNMKVSVVITTFQRKEEFRRALLSAINQTYGNIEIIVVDDNVNNDYSKYVREQIIGLGDKRIIYVKNTDNLGGALSRNVGIKKSKGNYVAFLDDDDIYLPHKVEEQLRLFVQSDDKKLAMVYCYCDAVKNGRVISEYRYDYRGSFLYTAMLMCVAATSQWMCRKDYLESVGCFNDMPCKQDSYLIVKMLAAGYTIDRVPKVLSQYDEEDKARISSKSAEQRIIGETMLRSLCREHYDKITEEQRSEVEFHFAYLLALHYINAKMWKDYRDSLETMLRIHPFSHKIVKLVLIRIKKSVLGK